MDMNADGLPDLVSRNDTTIRVRYNQMYDVDKLVSVKSFYGNYMELPGGFSRSPAHWDTR